MDRYDLIVIGAGPGGYVAALRASQLGMRVACVEKRNTLGGTCLNVGCIPSKALLESSHHYWEAKTTFPLHGISLKELKVNFPQMMTRKDKVVATTVKGIELLFKKNNITVFYGMATLDDGQTVRVTDQDAKSETLLKAKRILIATGSVVSPLPGLPFDGKQIVSSDEALSYRRVPKELLIVGGGVIGVEMGSIYARLGAKVRIIELGERLLMSMDADIGKTLQQCMAPYGIAFNFHTKITEVLHRDKEKLSIKAQRITDGKEQTFSAENILVAIGRLPNTKDLALETLGIQTDARGFILTDEDYCTSCSTVYAVGDVKQGMMLAHKASEEAVVCVERMHGMKSHVNPLSIPSVVYTWPEVAVIGKSEADLKQEDVPYKVGKFPYLASGKARASGDTAGFVKVLACQKSDEILGIQIIGARASDTIGEAVLAMEYRASAEDVAMAVHPHPTYLEAIKEAALIATGNRALHV